MRLPIVLMRFFKTDKQGNNVSLFHYITDLLIVCVYFHLFDMEFIFPIVMASYEYISPGSLNFCPISFNVLNIKSPILHTVHTLSSYNPKREQMAVTSLIFWSDILLAHDISEITLLDLPPNIAFIHLTTQLNGSKYGAFFK